MPRGDFWPTWQQRLQAGYVVDENGCHIWQRSRNNRGYGVIYLDGKSQLAHRAAWLARHGTWPDPALVLDHICNTKACVNADHLRETTNSMNIRRAYPNSDPVIEARRRGWRAANARRRQYAPGYSIGGE